MGVRISCQCAKSARILDASKGLYSADIMVHGGCENCDLLLVCELPCMSG